MRSKVTMAEIAKLAGVSESTVSRALTDSPLVSDATKEKIRTLSTQHGYTVNATASNLRRQSSGTLGLVIPVGEPDANNISDPFFLEMIGAVTQAATDRDYDLIISLPSETGSISRRRLLATGRADGLIVIGQAGRHDRLNELHDMGMPFMVWGGLLDQQKYVSVGSDNRRGGKLATDHLLTSGCQRILFLGDPSLPEVNLRYQGYLDAHQSRAVSVDPTCHIPAPFAGDGARGLVSAFLESGPRFDAIFAASDVLALSAMRALAQAGLSIPNDVAIVGYDDVMISSQVSPPLTTIRQDIASGGRRLVDLMLARIAGDPVVSETTETRLIIRGTSRK